MWWAGSKQLPPVSLETNENLVAEWRLCFPWLEIALHPDVLVHLQGGQKREPTRYYARAFAQGIVTVAQRRCQLLYIMRRGVIGIRHCVLLDPS